MGIEEQYAREVRNPLIECQLKKAKSGVHRGSLDIHEGSWYQRDKDDAVLAVPTITEPSDGESDDSVLSREYRRVRGIVMHEDRNGLHSEVQHDFFRDEYEGNWLSEWEDVAEYDESVPSPAEVDFERFEFSKYDEAKRIVTCAAVEQARNAELLASRWWTDEVQYQPLTIELMFVTTDLDVDIPGFGGQIDEVVIIRSGALPAGIYVVDYKLTHEIQDRHYKQVEAYRRAFWPDLGPVDGLILRVDPVEREVEVVSTHDDGWPDNAWTDFVDDAKDEYGRELMIPDLRTAPRY